ncbi:hypothetical protein CDO87_14290 [Sagittula sp. P11]|uniref:hypothetical protein n=1 Tax=Sagittula sp. P11 TaxID=2009329 RepID=UPI000C2D678E|nr:hypothetical protein [Sagittula sp. P11]AUC54274.1 hypothetical protein CDO87_14290 [Sagittula sp. P11]
MTRADIVIRAHSIGAGLTDLERIALGAALIQTVLRADKGEAVLAAARHIHEHGEALQDADFSGVGRLDARLITNTSGGAGTGTTHGTIERMVLSEIPAPRSDGATRGGPGRSPSSSLRAAWARIRAANDAIEDGWWGHVLAGLCFAIVAIGLMFLPLVLPAFEGGLK